MIESVDILCAGLAEKNKFDLIEARCIRSMCGIIWMDEIRNKDVGRIKSAARSLTG